MWDELLKVNSQKIISTEKDYKLNRMDNLHKKIEKRKAVWKEHLNIDA